MKILGLAVDAIGREFPEVFDQIRRNCPSCSDREACALDLKRDPNTLIWEAYCPNSDALNALVALTDVIRRGRGSGLEGVVWRKRGWLGRDATARSRSPPLSTQLRRQRSTCKNRPTRPKPEISRPTAELVSNRRWRSCRRHGTRLFGTHAERFEDVRAKRVDKRNIGGVASSRD